MANTLIASMLYEINYFNKELYLFIYLFIFLVMNYFTLINIYILKF